MDWGSLLYLGMTIALFLVFALIVVRTCRRKNRGRGEAPKYRMMDDD